MIFSNNIGLKDVRDKKLQGQLFFNPLSIIYPTEGAEVSNGETLEFEYEASALRIIYPTEGTEVQNAETLEIELE